MDSDARFSCLSYLDSLMHLQSAGSQWPRSPVQAIGWGKKGDQAECLSSSQGLFWACSHGSELQGGPGAAREEAGRLWTCTASLPPVSVVRASHWASPDPWSREKSSVLTEGACKVLWQLLQFLVSWFSPLILIFCVVLRVLRTQSLEWFYNNVKSRFKRFGSAKVLKNLYRKHRLESGVCFDIVGTLAACHPRGPWGAGGIEGGLAWRPHTLWPTHLGHRKWLKYLTLIRSGNTRAYTKDSKFLKKIHLLKKKKCICLTESVLVVACSQPSCSGAHGRIVQAHGVHSPARYWTHVPCTGRWILFLIN